MKIRLLKKRSTNYQQNGFILPVLLITGIVIVLMIVAISTGTVTNNSASTHGYYAIEAQLAADAGLDDALNKMNTVDGWTGTSSETALFSDTTQRIKTTYEVVVTNGSDSTHKTLTVTARTYSPVSAISPKITRKYVMDIEAVTSGSGPTSVSSGVGGLILDNNSKISGGDVVVNGKITMSNNSQIGLSTNPVNVRVADQVCPSPPDANYPRVCDASLGDAINGPITMGSTSKIYADVIATNQTDGSKMSNTGLRVGQKFDPVTLPSFDRASFKSTVNASGQALTGSQASCNSGGTVNWPANVKITGSVTVTNNCKIHINGNVWITGSLTANNNAQLIVQDSVGTTRPDIVVDGSGGIVLGNNGKVVPNSSSTGVELLTFWSAASCSPDCTLVTGTELYNSQGVTTITLSNNGSAQYSVLYAYWSKVVISNNGALGAVAGQTVQLGNNAVISFTASVPGSDNLIITWVKRGYMRVYN